MSEQGFAQFYSRRRQTLQDAPYKDTEFLYPHNEPWPEQSFDYPYGQAPTVSNIPPEELADWQKHVGRYYIQNALGNLKDGVTNLKDVSPFGQQSARFARESFERNGVTGYGPLSDDLFVELICEGLYSKYLGRLDPQDESLFRVPGDDGFEYLKSDQSCMKVVTSPWPDEYVAPAIAVVRRAKGATGDDRFKYQLFGIALAQLVDGVYQYLPDLVFRADEHPSPSAWWLAKYFVLQGAIHRINLVDHIKVHFPSDTINAVTKSVLPQWHLLQQLLLPHFRLTLPVNNTVLEGERSIINRDTWYPWSPVTAGGEEIRKLIPLAWAGGRFYWNERNTSYPRYSFSTDPGTVVDADDPAAGPIQTFIGLKASRYAQFLEDYHAPILAFASDVIARLPDPAATPEQDDLQWLEIQRWAYEISSRVPGFPDQRAIRSKDMLTNVCATIIWNAAIVHSSDHSTLHMMIDNHPVPFILRVKPPTSETAKVEQTIGQAIGPNGIKYLTGAVHGIDTLLEKLLNDKLSDLPELVRPIVTKWADGLLNHLADSLLEDLESRVLTEGSVPLCWPTDLIYCKMADLLFYRPHNSSLLFDCDYGFLPIDTNDKKKRAEQLEFEQLCKQLGRPIPSDAEREEMKGICRRFQDALLQTSLKYYDASGKPVNCEPGTANDLPCVLNKYGFPKVLPGSGDVSKDDPDGKAARRECCFSAGVQY